MRKLDVKLLMFLVLIANSCTLNKIFLHPIKLPSDTKEITFRSKLDTAIVHFGDQYQPVFLTAEKDTIQQDFTVESVIFQNSDRKNLNGWFLQSKTIKPTITLIHFHGNAGSLSHQYRAMSPLTSQGFRIFMFDYSGFGFSEGRATRKNVLKDAHSAIDFVKTRVGNKEKLVIYGQSLGGHLAGVVGTQRQDEIDALVIEGAFASHKDIAREFAGGFGKVMTKELYSTLDSIPNFKKPVLIIHSNEDETVPFSQGQKIFECAQEPKQFFEVEKCHICAPIFYTEEIADKIKQMVR